MIMICILFHAGRKINKWMATTGRNRRGNLDSLHHVVVVSERLSARFTTATTWFSKRRRPRGPPGVLRADSRSWLFRVGWSTAQSPDLRKKNLGHKFPGNKSPVLWYNSYSRHWTIVKFNWHFFKLTQQKYLCLMNTISREWILFL